MLPRIWVIHGPNLNLVGLHRDPDLYGSWSLARIDQELLEVGRALGLEVTCRQSNHEGVLIDWLHEAINLADVVVLNPGGYGHTSVALRDAVQSVPVPVIEVHLSSPSGRESFRRQSLLAEVVRGRIEGFGALSYILALHAASELVARRGDQDRDK